MDVVQSSLHAMNGRVKIGPLLLVEHAILAKFQLASALSTQQTSFAKDCYPTLAFMP